jgi:protein-S-isoprenylcysteine O-methyltransferase Ste14
MKKRIQIDSAILSFFIILTGILYAFPWLFSTNQVLDNVLDFLGITLILKGTYIRMAARGHKKAHSQQGTGLVTSGLYQHTRNPMYLGSFLLGCGFVLIVWPWWSLPLYALLFYVRFQRQIRIEEKHLKKHFGKIYDDYCRKVPQIFPSLKDLLRINVRRTLNWQETWSTKERRGIWSWPILAIILETIQQAIVFHRFDLSQTMITSLAAGLLFSVVLLWRYQMSR